MSSVLFPAVAGLSAFHRPPDPELARLVTRRLRSARESVMEAAGRLRGPVVGWQGPAADALAQEVQALTDALIRWAARSERLISSVDTLVADLDAELIRRIHDRSAVLNALGRLATLPADAHRDVDDALTRLGSNGWDAFLTPLRPFLP